MNKMYARQTGAIYYLWQQTARMVFLLFGVFFIMSILSQVFFAMMGYDITIQNYFMLTMIVSITSLALMQKMSDQYAQFLITRATPRKTVFMGVVCIIIGFSLLYSVLNEVFTLLSVGIVQLASEANILRANIDIWSVEARGSLTSFQQIAAYSPQHIVHQFLSTSQWACMFYLFMCLYRRWRKGTIITIIALCSFGILLSALPFIEAGRELVANMSQENMMRVMPITMKLLSKLQRCVIFIIEEWPWVRLGLATVCLVISYPIMARTPQPKQSA